MSLGIVFKGPEGIVLATDSRVTLNVERQQQGKSLILPSTFDNATKLLRIKDHDYVGVVTYGLGAIGQKEPRTAHSFIPEFEDELTQQNVGRLSVEAFSARFSEFFLRQWQTMMPSDYQGPDMTFFVGGFDEGAPYGRVFLFGIPSRPDPEEQSAGQGVFGMSWGGQLEYTSRIIQGYDPQLPNLVQQHLKLTDDQRQRLEEDLKANLTARIPYQFLPLQDCVDLSILLIRTTIEVQRWIIGIRGVGGNIDVATITKTDGFQSVQQKQIRGER